MTISQARKKVLAWFAGEVGYKEKATNSNLNDKTANAGSNNWTKYAAHLDSITGYYNGRKNGPRGEWCDIFYDDGYVSVFGYPTGRLMLYQPEKSLGAGTGYSAQYYKNNNAWYNTPEEADQVFFRTAAGVICHTGVVEVVGDTWIQTIEGNSNNMVCRHVYNKSDRYIAGYGRPNWSLVADIPSPNPVEPTNPSSPVNTGVINVETRELKKGSTGQAVKSMQLLLIGYGFSCGDSGADGDFGNATKGAVMAFQKKMKLTQDGICGVRTWTKLING